MSGFVFAMSVTAADSSWRAHAHLTRRPVSEWEGAGRHGSAEGRSKAEISTRLLLQLMKCHVCLVLITPKLLHCRWLPVKCHKITVVFLTRFICE